jgi:alkanesulfonate monooxygenase SsuD/methylene tetrahydromethanopterin reductase-like flavin-dependent oxidoreductase (luciferase family)
VQPGVLRHLDAAVLRGGQDRAGAAVRICSQLGFPDAPALLAQAAASLDLLSSGRFELGIGPTDTNAWDAIEAMGGVRRTPAEYSLILLRKKYHYRTNYSIHKR